jgi:ribosomal protein S18 acetylase RimI-like enzyme
MAEWRIEQADLANPDHAAAFLSLLDAYARDPMGGAQPLDAAVKQRLVRDVAAFPGFLVLLAYDGDAPIGIANAVPGYSTFAARPLLNLHDIAVLDAYRGRGVAQALLAALEAEARARGCCKLTLEVLSGNAAAQAAYRRFGFRPYALDPEAGEAHFWHKPLD